MTAPTLCKKHFYQVANYFDKDVAFSYELDEDRCLICNRVIFLEMARRHVEQTRRRLAVKTCQVSPVAA